MLQPHNVTLPVYAETEQEAQELQDALREFAITKYQQGIYPRAASLAKLIRQYGNSTMVNAFIK